MVFSFAVLIPKGKQYREDRVTLKKELRELRKYQEFYAQTEEKLQTLQHEKRHMISAFSSIFNPKRFEKQHRKYFSSLKLAEIKSADLEENFVVYEVNTSSQISSPKSFYNFLDALNKSDWIIGVNFPIDFKRDGELIRSNFTMKVYCDNKDKNTTQKKEAKIKEH